MCCLGRVYVYTVLRRKAVAAGEGNQREQRLVRGSNAIQQAKVAESRSIVL